MYGTERPRRPPHDTYGSVQARRARPPAGVPFPRHAAPAHVSQSVLLLLAIVIAAWVSSVRPSSSLAVPPLLAGTAAEATGQPVDGIECEVRERLLFHIHAHLAVFIDGQQRTIPRGIGIPAPRQITSSDQGPFVVGRSCYYRMHSHTADGIIHIESPVQRTYTVGDYCD